MKVLIVGGVAGGASAAARLRRNDEKAQIILFERGEYISFANCGLPYYIGGVIKDKKKLTLQTPESFRMRFNIDVRVQNEVTAVDAKNKKVTVQNLKDGTLYEESYDKLILSPGAYPVKPPVEGIDHEKVFTLRNIPDTYRIKEFCNTNKPKKALVIGGGYIGMEMAENLHALGVEVTVVEMAEHMIGAIDADMAAELHNHVRSKGVRLILKDGAEKIEAIGDGLRIKLRSGRILDADMVVSSAGVRPESKLANDAGLLIGETGGIAVNEHMQTSDPDIFAAGDAVEVTDFVTGQKALIPLASPANKQGRIAADNICGKDQKYSGTQGSAIIKLFDMTAAATGASEESLKKKGIRYQKSHTYSSSNAGYYPGGMPVAMKLLFTPDSGKILGVQATGYAGVDKRVDVVATAIRAGMTVSDLESLELCYAPPYSSAKDPVNIAGYVAGNILKGAWKPFFPEDMEIINPQDGILLDVRTRTEFEAGTVSGAVNIPLDELRKRTGEIAKDKTVYVFCQIGLRGYLASRILMQSGIRDVRNLSGGYRLYHEIQKSRKEEDATLDTLFIENDTQNVPENKKETKTVTVDACGLSCPGPVLEVYKAVSAAKPGDIIAVRVTDPAFGNDIKAWCDKTGNKFLEAGFRGAYFEVKIEKGIE